MNTNDPNRTFHRRAFLSATIIATICLTNASAPAGNSTRQERASSSTHEQTAAALHLPIPDVTVTDTGAAGANGADGNPGAVGGNGGSANATSTDAGNSATATGGQGGQGGNGGNGNVVGANGGNGGPGGVASATASNTDPSVPDPFSDATATAAELGEPAGIAEAAPKSSEGFSTFLARNLGFRS